MTTLSSEDKRRIQNNLTSIKLATDKMMEQRNQIYNLANEINEILKANEQDD